MLKKKSIKCIISHSPVYRESGFLTSHAHAAHFCVCVCVSVAAVQRFFGFFPLFK